MSKILIIDDDRTVCQSMKLLLSKSGHQVEAIFNPLNAIEHIEAFKPELVILDMNFSVATTGEQGLAMLKKIRARYDKLPIILITGWGSMELAIAGMKLGARDFITKPWDNQQLLQSIESILHLEREQKEVIDAPLTKIIGDSEAIQSVKALIRKVAPTHATVLVTGGSGTGKELVAEAIHELSGRNKEAFVKVNLGGLSNTLFESELFGHKKGAYTGALHDREGRFSVADKGSIFLDEIGDLALDLQVKLLRVLQEKTFEPLGSSKPKKVDVRVISATHKSLEDMVAQGVFREDLYYRLNLIHIHLPSLHERREDIPLLAKHFIHNWNKINDQDRYIEREALEWLQAQTYTGNIRQLKNILERSYLLASKDLLTIKDFKPHFSTRLSTSSSSITPQVGAVTLEQMEKAMIEKAMAFHNRNVSLVSQSLGITRSSLYRRLEKHGIER